MKKGFTLLELIVVIIVLGILASIAVPKYFEVVERGRTAEAVSILGLVRSSQMRHYAEKTTFVGGDCSNLDVGYTGTKFYKMACTAAADADEANDIATATRDGSKVPIPTGFDAYVLTIKINGNIGCTGTGCTKLGY